MHPIYMQRCIDLALLGAGYVSPNPLVGAVVVFQGKVIGEGYHRKFGEAHAEVNAINSVVDKSKLASSTLYVNLEPCNHHGKTPPCTELIISSGIKHVVVGMLDPNPLVAGKGIEKLKGHGINVTIDILKNECEELNKRFNSFMVNKRPYVILKWAQSSDGFLAPIRAEMSAEEFEEKRHLTGFIVQKMVHKWRCEEDAILVGTNTILTDNPALNTRAWDGRNPLRIALDFNNRIPESAKILDHSQPTLILTKDVNRKDKELEYVSCKSGELMPTNLMQLLYERGVSSLIIEGGAITLKPFLEQGLWDEIQQIVSPKILSNGVNAPITQGKLLETFNIDGCDVNIYRNTK